MSFDQYSVGILQALGNVFAAEPAGGYVFGNVTGSQLLAAVHAFDEKVEGQYDVITNNCASKLIDVVVFLVREEQWQYTPDICSLTFIVFLLGP